MDSDTKAVQRLLREPRRSEGRSALNIRNGSER